jgi:hypothetical protein
MESKNTMSESYIEKYFVAKCKEAGMRSFKMLPTFEAGMPDRIVLYRGVAGFAEIKATGKKPRQLQAVFLDELKKAGSFTGVVDTKTSALNWIQDFENYVEYKLPWPVL